MGRIKTKKIQNSHTILVDEFEWIYFKRKGKKKKRFYNRTIWVNHHFHRYWCGFGWTNGKNGVMNWCWQLSSANWEDDLEYYKDKLIENYNFHKQVLSGRVKLYKVKPQLLENNLMPVTSKGLILPTVYGDDEFLLLKKYTGSNFNLRIQTDDGKEFRVNRKDFNRILV